MLHPGRGRSGGLFAACFGLLIMACAGTSRAEFFEYTSTVSISSVSPAGSTVVGNPGPTVTLTTPGGTPITVTGLTSFDPAFHENALPPSGTDIIFATISATTTPTTPFEAVGFNFDFTMTITDFSDVNVGGVPNGTGVVHIVGRLDGSVGSGRKVNLNQLTSYATVPASGQTNINGVVYTVTLNPYVPPGTTAAGRFGAHVVASVPEPASFVLMGLGGIGLLGYLRGRKSTATTQV